MKLITLIFLGVTSTVLAAPIAHADMGRADVIKNEPGLPIQSKFDAWCVEKYADCVVTIDDDKISVDGSSGVTRNNLIKWERNDNYRDASGFIGPHHLYSYKFIYKVADGRWKKAVIVFQNSRTSDRFYERLKLWNPKKEANCQYNFDTRKVEC